MLKFVKDNKLLLGLCIAVLILLIIVSSIVISYVKHNQKVGKVAVEETYKDKDGQDTEMMHPDYIPEIDEPFDGTKDSYTVSDLVLGEPKTYKKSTNAGSGAVLMGGARGAALIKAYGGELYLYNLNTEKTFRIDRFTSYGNVDDNKKYVFYSKYSNPITKEKEKQILLILPTATNERTNVGELEAGYTIINSAYYNGLFFYAASDVSGTKFTSGIVRADKDINNAIVTKYQTLLSKYNFTMFKSFGDKIYGYDKNSNSIYDVTSGVAVKKSTVPTQYLLDFAVSNNNVFLYYTDLKNVYYSLNNQIKNNFDGAYSPIWLDENQLLLLVDSNLHIYNVKEDKLIPVLYGVSNFYTAKDKIYLQDGTETTNIKAIDILNR
ncbi:hypothetical protein [Priestia aryabhattai]